MRIYGKITRCLIVCATIGLPCFSIASWKESACNNVTEEKSCVSVSDNYKQPYCITNVNYNRWDQDVDNASSCMLPIFTNKFSSIDSKKNTKDIIEDYCNSLLGELNEWRIYFAKSNDSSNDFDWQQTFDSHQSLFLYALCSSFKDDGWNMPFINSNNNLLSEVYKGDLVKTLNLQQRSVDWKDFCSLKDELSLNRCDVGIYATKIFAWIMSDLFKIEYAQVLAVDSAEDFESNKKVQEFMSWYYSITASSEQGRTEDIYKKTISQLKSDQKYYKNVLDTVKIIDNGKLATLAKNLNCSTWWNIVWMDFVACALHFSQWKWTALTPAFVTLAYNELLHYRHFVAYYTYAMQKKAKDGKNLEIESQALDFQKYADMQVEAFVLTENNFEEFSMTYPLHIWLLMYIEKAEKFRNNFAGVITSFYSLSEKLQNVQNPPY